MSVLLLSCFSDTITTDAIGASAALDSGAESRTLLLSVLGLRQIGKGIFLPAAGVSRFNTKCRVISLAGEIALGKGNSSE